MKPISNALITLTAVISQFACFANCRAVAADDAVVRPGFVRLADAATHGQGKLYVLIDGALANPDGYDAGDVTGGIGLTPGSHQVAIKRNGMIEASTRIQIVADTTVILIPYTEWIPPTLTSPGHWILRIHRLKHLDPTTTRTAAFVSVTQQPEQEVEISSPNGKWTKLFVKRLAITPALIRHSEGYVPLRAKSTPLTSIPIGTPGNYVVVLYNDPNGNLQSLTFQDYRYR